MKNTTFAAILMFLAAAVGALVAGALYLRRREKELDEYEQLLFSEDFSDDEADEDEADLESEEDVTVEAPLDADGE